MEAKPRRLLPRYALLLSQDQLLRNGVLLTLASLATALLGAAYWSLAGLRYDVADVGRGYSAVSMMMFLAGAAQLNLSDVLVRFTPSAGRQTRRLILLSYLTAVVTAMVVAAGFVLLIPRLAPGLDALHSPLMGAVFVASTMAYAVFVLQDGALTGLRRASWVLAENSLFSSVKLIAVLAFSLIAAAQGIMLSWAIGLLVSLVFTNAYLFGWAVPDRERELRRVAQLPLPDGETHREATEPVSGVVRYMALTYVGGLCWLAATSLPQVLLLNMLGARASAYFSVSWVITSMLYLVSANMGYSLVVEAVGDPGRLALAVRTVLRRTGAALLLAVLVLLAAAPLVLRLFGPGYPGHAGALLRLLALSALPNLVNSTALASFRVQRRLRSFVLVDAGLCAAVFGLAALLVPHLGVVGMGVAWLGAQSATAGILLLCRSSWMPAATENEGDLRCRSAAQTAADTYPG